MGSPVKFRGVTIGNVPTIGIAPDRRHVEVTCGIIVSQLVSLKLLDTSPKAELLPFGRKRLSDSRGPAGSAHAARLGPGSPGSSSSRSTSSSSRTTRRRFFRFAVPVNYVPAACVDDEEPGGRRREGGEPIPEIADQLVLVTSRVNHLLTTVDEENLPLQAAQSLAQAG